MADRPSETIAAFCLGDEYGKVKNKKLVCLVIWVGIFPIACSGAVE